MHGIETDNFVYGDAGGDMSDFAKGGDDTYNQLSGTFFPNIFYGDAGSNMSGHAQGGNDTFNKTGGEGSTFYGDAGGNMSDYAQGGNDTFQASSPGLGNKNLFYGDAGGNMGDHAIGGNDTYIGRQRIAKRRHRIQLEQSLRRCADRVRRRSGRQRQSDRRQCSKPASCRNIRYHACR
ncbi:hypothetical protein ACVWXM_001417 [Bradyrhizobium sp. GM7.3]